MSADCGHDCSEVKEHVYDYQHGELSAADCDRIRVHLDECPECVALYSEEETIRRKLSACACESAPAELRARVMTFLATFRVTG